MKKIHDVSKQGAHSKAHKCPKAKELLGPPVDVWSVEDAQTTEDVILHCMPAFGAAYVRRIYQILDLAIGRGVPLIMAVAGPVTVSNQHRAWLIPLLKTGWVAYLTITDAACYHDGHDSLEKFDARPLREAAIEGRDLEYGENKVIRITDVGMKEEILYKQDQFFTALLRQPEFQRKMTGTEFRHLVGKYYQAQEKAHGVKPGLLSTCYDMGIPVFVGAPGDGSAYLNSVKLWALNRLGVINHKFGIDVHEEVFESCAYHYYGLTHDPKQLAILILGGGVPKNFSLQPEPTLSQIFMLDDIRGYDYDVQIVSSPVTDGSLSGCKGQEAHTWGKVSREALASTVESVQADYSMIMPFIVRALLEKRKRVIKQYDAKKVHFPVREQDKGYLRGYATHPYRLYDLREELRSALLCKINEPKQLKRLKSTFNFPLQFLARAKGGGMGDDV
ncbi:MAG: deoxyhypusine synthase family protein [Patescibacteria group bacterium]